MSLLQEKFPDSYVHKDGANGCEAYNVLRRMDKSLDAHSFNTVVLFVGTNDVMVGSYVLLLFYLLTSIFSEFRSQDTNASCTSVQILDPLHLFFLSSSLTNTIIKITLIYVIHMV